MNLVELNHALLKLRLGGMASGLESRLLQAQAEPLAPIDFISALVSDELLRRGDRLIERRVKHAAFRDTGKTLDAFDFDFNKKMDRRLVFELATARFVTQHEDALFLGPPGTGKSHVAQAIGHAAIQQGHRVLYREAHVLLEDLAQATLEGTRRSSWRSSPAPTTRCPSHGRSCTRSRRTRSRAPASCTVLEWDDVDLADKKISITKAWD